MICLIVLTLYILSTSGSISPLCSWMLLVKSTMLQSFGPGLHFEDTGLPISFPPSNQSWSNCKRSWPIPLPSGQKDYKNNPLSTNLPPSVFQSFEGFLSCKFFGDLPVLVPCTKHSMHSVKCLALERASCCIKHANADCPVCQATQPLPAQQVDTRGW